MKGPLCAVMVVSLLAPVAASAGQPDCSQQKVDPSCSEGGDLATCRAAAARARSKLAKGWPAAFCMLDAGCRRNDAESCAMLPEYFERGLGVTRDVAKADASEIKACDLGSASACMRGLLRRQVEYDKKRLGARTRMLQGWELAVKGCALGEDKACVELEIPYTFAELSPELDRKATEVLDAACKRKSDLCRIREDRKPFEALEASCQAGKLPSCALAGELFWKGCGILKDRPKAEAFLAKSCEKGDCDACHQLALMARESGDAAAGAKAAGVAAAACERACTSKAKRPERPALGMAAGTCLQAEESYCSLAAMYLLEGIGVKRNEAKATPLLLKSCASPRCPMLEKLLVRGKLPANEAKKALSELERQCRKDMDRDSAGSQECDAVNLYPEVQKRLSACDGGNMQACFEIAEKVWGFDGDWAEVLVRQACEANIPQSCSMLADKYWGETADKDPGLTALVQQLTSKIAAACDGGSGAACVELGDFYSSHSRQGEDSDAAASGFRTKGYELMAKACEAGTVRDCAAPARAYISGEHVAADAARGQALLEKACTGGESESCDDLAHALSKANGEPRHVDELLLRGCELRGETSCADLKLRFVKKEVSADIVPQVKATLEKACKAKVDGSCL